jgi:hypothetical protein
MASLKGAEERVGQVHMSPRGPKLHKESNGKGDSGEGHVPRGVNLNKESLILEGSEVLTLGHLHSSVEEPVLQALNSYTAL